MSQQINLEAALTEWRLVLANERVIAEPTGIEAYRNNTIAVDRQILAILRPRNTNEVVALVRIAAEHLTPLYPISTGHNWGYGSANPVVDGCVIVDLSLMTEIDASDMDLGVISVQPGVTQAALRDFLDQQDLPFLVPVHGGGPTCSLIGNALERGYGITPHADHFGAVTSLEAVLPNAEVYRSALTDLGAPTIDRAFKWGVGPYLDGLFSQGNFGIVTRMSIALAPIPERVETFFFGVPDEANFLDTVSAIREVLRSVGSVTGSINLMNRRRILSMMEPYPHDQVGPEGILTDDTIATMAQQAQVMPWTGIGALYGTTAVVKAARKEIRKRLKHSVRRLLFITPSFVQQTKQVLAKVPGHGGRRVWNYVNTLDKSLQLIAGKPSEIALPLAYWKSGIKPAVNSTQPIDPAADGCGLIWYSPLVPMAPERVRDYVKKVDTICRDHGIEPLITLTSLSDRCFDSTVPLLFDRQDPQAAEQAHACYAALLEAGRVLGCVPYRTSIASMPWYTESAGPHWQLAHQIKTALDPDGLIAPGRYCAG